MGGKSIFDPFEDGGFLRFGFSKKRAVFL